MFKFSFLSLITLFLSIAIILALPLPSQPGSSDGSHGSSEAHGSSEDGLIQPYLRPYGVPTGPPVGADAPVGRRVVSYQPAWRTPFEAQRKIPLENHESYAVPLPGLPGLPLDENQPGPSRSQPGPSQRQPSTSQQPKKGFFGKITNWFKGKFGKGKDKGKGRGKQCRFAFRKLQQG